MRNRLNRLDREIDRIRQDQAHFHLVIVNELKAIREKAHRASGLGHDVRESEWRLAERLKKIEAALAPTERCDSCGQMVAKKE